MVTKIRSEAIRWFKYLALRSCSTLFPIFAFSLLFLFLFVFRFSKVCLLHSSYVPALTFGCKAFYPFTFTTASQFHTSVDRFPYQAFPNPTLCNCKNSTFFNHEVNHHHSVHGRCGCSPGSPRCRQCPNGPGACPHGSAFPARSPHITNYPGTSDARHLPGYALLFLRGRRAQEP